MSRSRDYVAFEDSRVVERRPVAVVGAGPAGLAAAAALSARDCPAVLIEAGGELATRRRDDPASLVTGTGGAGLYSDGKFSFYPSGTSVWRLRPRGRLDESYAWLTAVLAEHGLAVPGLPGREDAHRGATGRGYKAYPSYYLGLAGREALIARLAAGVPELRCRTMLTGLRVEEDGLLLRLSSPGPDRTVATQALVLSTGRFGPLLMRRLFQPADMRYRRLEVGVRLEQPAGGFFLRDSEQLDPKWLLPGGDAEYRTFCCCREGLVAATEYDGLWSVSGRADGPPTGLSNVGLNARVLDAQRGERLWRELEPRLRVAQAPLAEPLAGFGEPGRRGPLADLLGDEVTRLVQRGVELLRDRYPAGALDDTTLVGPAIEGVGMYPRVGDDLRTPMPGVWVAGDTTGTFRGLTAALVSGYAAGVAAAEHLQGPGERDAR